MTLREPAYAKVNLSLDVVGRRADGYHLLSMVCQTVSLCDTLTFVRKPGAPLSVRVEQAPEIPSGPENLVYRAAERFFAAAGEDDRGVEITIEKHIPAQAGLGGGSADAAAALRGLCRLYGKRLSKETLDAIALAVGADVPFCLCGGTALAEGIGERLTPLKALPRCLFVVVKPPFGVSTKEAYQKIDARPRRRAAVYAGCAAGAAKRQPSGAGARSSATGFRKRLPYRRWRRCAGACGKRGRWARA